MSRKSKVGQGHAPVVVFKTWCGFEGSETWLGHETAVSAKAAIRKELEAREAYCRKFDPSSAQPFKTAMLDLKGAPINELRAGSTWERRLHADGYTFVYRIERML